MAQKNIKVIYDTCQQLIKTADDDIKNKREVNQSTLSGIEDAFEDIIEYIKFYLIQCQNKFYGVLLMDLELEVNFSQRGPIDIQIQRIPYALTINPMYCLGYKFPEFVGLIVNEMNKLVYMHPARYADINSERDEEKHSLLEKASDVETSNLIKSDMYMVPKNSTENTHSNGLRLPESIYTADELKRDCNIKTADNQTLEYYFNILKRFKKKNDSQENNPNKNIAMSAMPISFGDSGEGNQQSPQGQQNPSQQSNNSGQTIASPNNQNGDAVHQWEGTDADEMKDTVTSMISEVLDSLEEKERGYIAGGMMSYIKKLLEKPEIDWKGILKKMVGSIPIPYRKTRTRLNRRLPFRADLSGRLPKRIVNVVCCFDTSGSMSDSDLKYCMNEVFNIVKVYEGYKITVIECDAEIQRVYQAKKMEDLQLKMKGRGGTSFVPAIEFINGTGQYSDRKKYPLAGSFKDALMVYFTDGYGDMEIPKPRTFRNLWVVLKDVKCLSLKEPYGDVKSLSMDKKWNKQKNDNSF